MSFLRVSGERELRNGNALWKAVDVLQFSVVVQSCDSPFGVARPCWVRCGLHVGKKFKKKNTILSLKTVICLNSASMIRNWAWKTKILTEPTSECPRFDYPFLHNTYSIDGGNHARSQFVVTFSYTQLETPAAWLGTIQCWSSLSTCN